MGGSESSEDDSDNDLLGKASSPKAKSLMPDMEAVVPVTRVLKKKKLKINVNRPTGKRVVFDEEDIDLPPLAAIAAAGNTSAIYEDKVLDRYKKEREKLKEADKEDKLQVRQLLKEKRMKKKAKLKRGMPLLN